MSNEIANRPRAALAVSEIIAVFTIIPGLITGFAERTTGSFGGANCGSVLGGGGDDLTVTGLTVCEKTLSAATTWTWLLLIVGVLALVTGRVVDTMQKNAYVPSSTASI